MTFLRTVICAAGLTLLAACQTNDLKEPPVPMGNFALGLNIVVADNMQKVPISRSATADEWETAVKKAVFDRFDRYEGTKAYNFGISVDAFALAPPGVPLVLSPKSVLAITVTLWDDAAGKKLNDEAKQLIIFENASAETVVGSGLTQTKQKQMEILSYNAAKAIEKWMVENPQWFGITAGEATFASTSAAIAPADQKAHAAQQTVANHGVNNSAANQGGTNKPDAAGPPSIGTSPTLGATLP